MGENPEKSRKQAVARERPTQSRVGGSAQNECRIPAITPSCPMPAAGVVPGPP
jgi:hypothetical protein